LARMDQRQMVRYRSRQNFPRIPATHFLLYAARREEVIEKP